MDRSHPLASAHQVQALVFARLIDARADGCGLRMARRVGRADETVAERRKRLGTARAQARAKSEGFRGILARLLSVLAFPLARCGPCLVGHDLPGAAP